MEIYCRLLESNPQDVNALHLLGMAYHEEGRHEQALGLLQRAIAVKPDAAALYNSFGVIQLALGHYAEARTALERAIALDPAPHEPYSNLGTALNHLGATDAASRCFEEALRRNPHDGTSCRHLGKLAEMRGESGTAEALYRRAIASPNSARAGLLGLARLLTGRKRFEEAQNVLQDATARFPNDPEMWFQLGAAWVRVGDHAEAARQFERSLAIEPNSPIAHDQYGLSLVALDRAGDAAKQFREAVRLAPDRPEYQVHLAVALRRLDRLAEAIELLQQVREAVPNMIEAKCELGIAYRRRGDPERAEPLLDDVLREVPNHGEALYELAKLYECQKKIGKTIELGVRLLKENRSFAPAHLLLGTALLERLAPEQRMRMTLPERAGVTEKAVSHLAQAARLAPSAETFGALGNGLMRAERHGEAFEALRQALSLRPDFAPACIEMGKAHLETGNTEEARKCFRKAIEHDPNRAEAYYELSRFGRFDDADVVAKLRELLRNEDRPVAERMLGRFALARHLDNQKDYNAAFGEYLRANAMKMELRGKGRPEGEAGPGEVNELEAGRRHIEVFQKEFVEARRGWGDASELPIFIVGMPRSGTTLVEQILSSHGRIHGAGELIHMSDLALSLPFRLKTDMRYPRAVELLDEAMAGKLAAEYLGELHKRSHSAARITDKMPTNFRHLGLIALLLPNARIVHVIRDPMDVCVSCLKQNLEWPFCDMQAVGRYYRAYERLMGHWKSVLPLQILDVRYEDLVANQEPESRRLIEFCGLPWDEQCLNFAETERAVQTPSKWQVRQPIYRSSVGGWRKYAEHLGPLMDALARS
ncbi:MAG: tetratricopeptide repeat protein [Planctomycetaceae bacterium]|nr:tetratricopeptide repeat protein [Planctomycetaceae bacterium]